MLSAAHDQIKAKEPGDGAARRPPRPHEPGWLQRVFDTPGADALHKFDIANVHLRGTVDAVVHRYDEFRSWLAAARLHRPAVGDRARLSRPTRRSRPTPPTRTATPSQAAYLTQSLLGLGEAGAPQVFVTLHDGSLDGEYATEGLEQIDETPGGDYPVTRRASFAAVHRLVDDWDQLMAWRAEQREQEQEQRVEQGKAALGRATRGRTQGPRGALRVHAGQDDLARPCTGADRRPAEPPARPRPRAPRGARAASSGRARSRAGTRSAPTSTPWPSRS